MRIAGGRRLIRHPGAAGAAVRRSGLPGGGSGCSAGWPGSVAAALRRRNSSRMVLAQKMAPMTAKIGHSNV